MFLCLTDDILYKYKLLEKILSVVALCNFEGDLPDEKIQNQIKASIHL